MLEGCPRPLPPRDCLLWPRSLAQPLPGAQAHRSLSEAREGLLGPREFPALPQGGEGALLLNEDSGLMGSARQRGASPLSGPPRSWPAPGAGGSSRGRRAHPQRWWDSVLWELRRKTGRGLSWRGRRGTQQGVCWGRGLVGGTAHLEVSGGVPAASAAGQRALIRSQEQQGPQHRNRLQKTVPPLSGSWLAWAGQRGFCVLGTGTFSPSCPALEECPPPQPRPSPAHACTLEAVTV